MKACSYSLVALATLALASSARAHELPFKGKTTNIFTSGQDGTFSFDVGGRVAPMLRVSGTGTMTVDPITGDAVGSATFIDPTGSKAFITFDFAQDRLGGLSGTFEITGGTGKWLGHFGGGNVTGQMGDTTMILIFDGTIDH